MASVCRQGGGGLQACRTSYFEANGQFLLDVLCSKKKTAEVTTTIVGIPPRSFTHWHVGSPARLADPWSSRGIHFARLASVLGVVFTVNAGGSSRPTPAWD